MENKHKGTKNLIPTNKRSKEEVRENARKGGIQSGVTRRRQKSIRQILDLMDKQPVSEEQALTLKDFNIEKPTFRDAVFGTLYAQVFKGDIRAVELYLKLKGEYPKDNIIDKSLTIIWNEKRYDINTKTE